MASVRRQIFDAVEAKLEEVRGALDWSTLLRNPRDPIGEDQMNAIALGEGGDLEPGSLTGGVETNTLEFEVGLLVVETADLTAEALLDAGFVAVCDKLLDPADIQLGGLAVDIRRGSLTPAFVGRGRDGARVVGAQSIGFFVDYWAREGDASTPAP